MKTVKDIKKNCKACNKVFQLEYSAQLYCSTACFKTTNREKHKIWENREENKAKRAIYIKSYAEKNKNKIAEYRKTYNKERISQEKDSYLKRKYNITLYQYQELLQKQDNLCSLCKKKCSSNKSLSVDHDHSCCSEKKSCGKCIRGLLCIMCNRNIGWVENISIAVINYYLEMGIVNKSGKEIHTKNVDPFYHLEGKALAQKIYHLKRSFGMTLKDFAEMLEEQNGVCALCKRQCPSGRFLSVDHNHNCCPGRNTCGKCIRGLLCIICNKNIGWLEDITLLSIGDYLGVR